MHFWAGTELKFSTMERLQNNIFFASFINLNQMLLKIVIKVQEIHNILYVLFGQFPLVFNYMYCMIQNFSNLLDEK